MRVRICQLWKRTFFLNILSFDRDEIDEIEEILSTESTGQKCIDNQNLFKAIEIGSHLKKIPLCNEMSIVLLATFRIFFRNARETN